MISVIIVNYNEAEKLRHCLQSVTNFVGEIVVIDLNSDDRSEEVFEEFNAKVFQHKLVPFVELVRNFAISKASGDWILVLDPDEVLPSGLKNKLHEIVGEDKFDAVNIPRKNIFFGSWIKHTNWWPDYHVRFFKKGKVEWTNRIHVYPKVLGKIFKLPKDENIAIVHFGYDNIGQFIDRQNRYSTFEAEQRYLSGERFSWIFLIFWPTREFLVRYIKHLGILDGFYGFALTFLMGVSRLMIAIKIWELERKKA